MSAGLLGAAVVFAIKPEPAGRPEPLSPADTGIEVSAVPLVEQAFRRGIGFSHVQASEKLTALSETLGGGVCVFDFDGDGWQDVFFVGGSGHRRHYGRQAWWRKTGGSVLYRNLEGRYFEDVTAKAGLNRPLWGMGCATGDLDNDGDPDLLVTGLGENRLYRNDGGLFTDVSEQAGVAGEAWSTSAAIADYNGDGLLDIYICNYINYTKGTRTFEAGAGYAATVPVDFNASAYDGIANRLYRNDGQWRFSQVAETAGVADASGRALTALWLYADEDRLPDLLVVNDRGSPSRLFLNAPSGVFNAAPPGFHVETPGRGAAAGDLNGDGRSDIVITAPVGQSTVALLSGLSQTGETDGQGFSDRAWEAGIARERDLALSGWGSVLADVNNDGSLDVLIANGLATPDMDTAYVPQGQPVRLLLNRVMPERNAHTFDHADRSWGDVLSGRGIAYGDFDNDGDFDIVIAHNNDRAHLYVNEATAGNSDDRHWLGIELVDRTGNRDGFGATVIASFNDGRSLGRMVRENFSRAGFLSQSEHRLHFGLGGRTRVDRLEVHWADGGRDVFHHVPADQYISIRQNGSWTPQASGSADAQPRLKPPFDRFRPDYLYWLTQVELTEERRRVLVEGYGQADAALRRRLIDGFEEKPSRLPPLAIVQSALLDETPSSKLTAIGWLRRHESETAMEWLLALLDNPETEVDTACAVTETLRHFFQEEEAVIYRKYRAVPYLVRLLESADPPVQRCALRALAEAERYRGVHAILALLDSPSAAVRAEAARTLGRIRERKALAALRDIIAGEDESPAVQAQALIALKRLNDPDTERYLQSLLHERRGRRFPENLTSAVGVAHALLVPPAPGGRISAVPGHHDDTDRAVVAPAGVTAFLTQTLEAAGLGDPERASLLDEHPAFTGKLAEVLAVIGNPPATGLLTALLRHGGERTRTAVYRALVLHRTASTAAIAENGLFDRSRVVREAVAAAFIQRGAEISDHGLKKLLENKKTADTGLTLATLSQARLAAEAVDLWLQRLPPPSLMPAVLEACRRLAFPVAGLPGDLLEAGNGDFRRAAVGCIAQQDEPGWAAEIERRILMAADKGDTVEVASMLEVMLPRPRPWVRKLVLALVSRDEVPATVWLEVLPAAAETPLGEALLFRALRRDDEALQRRAVDLLRGYAGKPHVQNKLWSIFSDPGYPDALRVAAGTALIDVRRDDVLSFVED